VRGRSHYRRFIVILDSGFWRCLTDAATNRGASRSLPAADLRISFGALMECSREGASGSGRIPRNLHDAALIATRSGARFYGRFRARVHRSRASERPLSFSFTRPRSRGANALKEPIKTAPTPPSVSAIARRDEGRTGEPARRSPPRFTLRPRVSRSVAITAFISWKKSS